MTFFVGDVIRCENPYYGFMGPDTSGVRVLGLSYSQRFEVTKVFNWHDGSQSLWVKYTPRSRSSARPGFDGSERGPYCSLRFRIEVSNPNRMFQYDPSQLGDLDDGI